MADSVAPGGHTDEGAPALGKYAPFARLGAGGMADVFLAVSRGLVGFNKLVVVKRLRASDDSVHVRMFLDEARLAARLSHPNIINTYEVGEYQGKLFITMEYLEGQPLQALQKWLEASKKSLSEPLVAYVAVQALKGLHYAHELSDYDGAPLGVVHRDVSPHNLMITYGGEVKVLDFGIAKAAMNATHTETGVLKGKVRYMAPEQAAERNVDRRADVFAFGIVLWEMLAQRRLYTGDSLSILTRIGSEDAPSIRTVRPDVSLELEAVVAKALRRKVDERYQTAEAMRLDLEKVLRGKHDVAPDVELARLMTEAFAVRRDNVRARIKAFLAALPPSDSSASMPALGQSVDNLPVLGAEPSGPTPSRARVAHPQSANVRWPRRRWPLVTVAAFLLVGLGAGAYALRDGRTAGTSAPAGARTASIPTPLDTSPSSALEAPASAAAATSSIATSTSSAASATASTRAAPSATAPTFPALPRWRPAPVAPPASTTARPKIRVLDEEAP
jgi:serine/threonine protein kinase